MTKSICELQNKNSISTELLQEIKKMENELKRKNDEYEKLNANYREIYGSYILAKTNLDDTTNINFQELLEEKCKLENDMDNYEKAIYEINENLISLKEAHKEELKEVHEENTNLYSTIDKFKEEVEYMKENYKQLEKMNQDKINTIENLEKEMMDMKEEKKMVGEKLDLVQSQQRMIQMEIKNLNKEKEQLKEKEETLKNEKEKVKQCKEVLKIEEKQIDTNKQVLDKEKEQIEKNKEELKLMQQNLNKEKEQIEKNKQELDKEKQIYENDKKNIMLKNEDLKKLLDEYKEEIMNKEGHIKQIEEKILLLEDEKKNFQNKIDILDNKMQEFKNEITNEKKLNYQLKDDIDNKQNEVIKRDSIIEILYNKLKEKENDITLFQNENLSLRNCQKELNKILDNKKNEMINIEKDLYEKLAKLLIKKKIRQRDDLHFDGHPQSSILKILWFGYVDICKCILKNRDGYLYKGNKNHRFICAYDTDLFLDINVENTKKGLLSFKNETRGIFQLNDEEAKKLVYVGPFNKFKGFNFCISSNKNNLEIVKGNKCTYIFEEMYVTKKGTKLVLIKEKESGKYFSGLNKNLYLEKKKRGVDKLDYNNVVNKLINYIANEKEENCNMIIKTSDQKLKIENEKNTCLVQKKKNSDNSYNNEEKTNLVTKRSKTPIRKENSLHSKYDKTKTTKITNQLKKYDSKEKQNKEKSTSEKQTGKKLASEKNNEEKLTNGKINEDKLNNEKNNEDKLNNNRELSDENLHKYKIAKEMLLLSDSNSSSTCDDENIYHLKNKYNHTEQNEFIHNNVINKSIATNYIENINTSLFKYSKCSENYNNTNIVLTTNKEEAILFEIFNYEQIVEHDAIKLASECVFNFLLNYNKSNLHDLSNIGSEGNSNIFSGIDDDWCILPAYL
ncbi:hypothetical protein PFBG_03445 [Plasmodium falciparum 7G8]|uniref:Autophagy-related protein 23 n=2 Tax=Plasmodium falciparum TaxID=5833 RepID=A0A024X547_PLAFC|nr:hypothetical protein PFMC_03330 [Plasmodium falciparum CAMP/Malaysia]EUR70217.1 hypothetical protein PFBG_03445 [Plasmodium falciparum 7G8]